MNKIIIGIHGIGNKPPEDTLRNWWLNSIYEGLNKQHKSIPKITFEMAYWADILHKNPLNPGQTNRKEPDFMTEKYVPEETGKIRKPEGFRQKAIEYLEKYYDKLIVNGVLSLENKTITELFIHRHMKDLESYFTPVYVEYKGKKMLARDAIMDRLAEKIISHKDKKILLVAHSMGSIISHDVLFERVPEIEIDTLITIGSPLGQKYVIDNYKFTQKTMNKLIVPDNIKSGWFNFADLEDQVAIYNRLADFYKGSSRNLTITDTLVKNNFEYNGESNPHKSFGYLRTPEVAGALASFLKPERTGLIEWMKNKINRFWNQRESGPKFF